MKKFIVVPILIILLVQLTACSCDEFMQAVGQFGKGLSETTRELEGAAKLSGSNQDTFDENMAYSNYVDAQSSEEKEYWYSKYSELREERLRREQDRKDDLRHFELLDAIRNRN